MKKVKTNIYELIHKSTVGVNYTTYVHVPEKTTKSNIMKIAKKNHIINKNIVSLKLKLTY